MNDFSKNKIKNLNCRVYSSGMRSWYLAIQYGRVKTVPGNSRLPDPQGLSKFSAPHPAINGSPFHWR